MAEDAQKIKEFSEHILKLHINWSDINCMLNKKNNLLSSSFFTNLFFVLFSFFFFLPNTVLLMLLYEHFVVYFLAVFTCYIYYLFVLEIFISLLSLFLLLLFLFFFFFHSLHSWSKILRCCFPILTSFCLIKPLPFCHSHLFLLLNFGLLN